MIFLTGNLVRLAFFLFVFWNQCLSSEGQTSTTCQKNVDLGFVLDNSGSIERGNFEKMKTFVKDVTAYFNVTSGDTQVSVMSFADNPQLHIYFSSFYPNKASLDYAIGSISYTGGGTATTLALHVAYNDMFSKRFGARGPGTKKVLILLTDGYSNTRQVAAPAQLLKNSGVVIFAVAIGTKVTELYKIASQPVDKHVIQISGFSDLSVLAKNISEGACEASRHLVLCDDDNMTAIFVRADLPKNVSVEHLYLRDGRCRASHNVTHVFVTTPLHGCGTGYEENDQTMFFTNTLSERNYSSTEGITRDYLFSANMMCTYGRKRTVGSFSFEPARQRLPVSIKGKGNFTLALDFYKTSLYNDDYSQDDYPVFKELTENIYIQYSIATSNPDLVVHAETCRATPTNKHYDTPSYVFITTGCAQDETIVHFDQGVGRVKQFSIQAFRFLSQHRFVYIHCDLVVCNRNSLNSTCARGANCQTRARRDVRQTASAVNSQKYPLSLGPLMYAKNSGKDKPSDTKADAGDFTVTGSLIGVGCIAILLAAILLFVLKRRRNLPQSVVEGITNVAMDNTKA